MTRTASLLTAWIPIYLMQWIAWRAFLLTLVVEQAIVPLLGYALWTRAAPTEAGVGTYYVAILIVQLATVSYEHHTFSNGIYAGTLGAALLQPQPVILPVLAQNLAMRFLHLLVGIPLVVGMLAFGDIPISLKHVAIALPALILAAALRFVVTVALALSALWTQRAHAIVDFGELLIVLLGGAAIPLAFMPDRVRAVVDVLPFRAMLGFPAEVLAGSLDGRAMAIGYAFQTMWLAIGVLIARIVWVRGHRHFTAIGG